MFRLSNLIKSTLENEKSRTLNGSIMIWNFTNRCNLLCHHCYSKADANKKDTLTFEEIQQTIKKLKSGGVNFVIFSGGEPLLRADIFDIAQCMKDNEIMTYLSTNGMYIKEHNVDKIVSKKMMIHLQSFLNENYSNGTRKNKGKRKNRTRKVND